MLELHAPVVGPGHQVVEHQLKSVSILNSFYIDSNFGVIGKFSKEVCSGCLHVQVVNEDDEEQRAQHTLPGGLQTAPPTTQ